MDDPNTNDPRPPAPLRLSSRLRQVSYVVYELFQIDEKDVVLVGI